MELREKKGPKETFGFKKKTHTKDPQDPSATGKEVMEEEYEEEKSDEADEESNPSLRNP